MSEDMARLVMCSCGLAMYAIESFRGWVYVCEDCDPEMMSQVAQ